MDAISRNWGHVLAAAPQLHPGFCADTVLLFDIDHDRQRCRRRHENFLQFIYNAFVLKGALDQETESCFSIQRYDIICSINMISSADFAAHMVALQSKKGHNFHRLQHHVPSQTHTAWRFSIPNAALLLPTFIITGGSVLQNLTTQHYIMKQA